VLSNGGAARGLPISCFLNSVGDSLESIVGTWNQNVWLAANGETDGHILKFTRDGKFVMQIGKPGPQTNSLDTTRLGRPANMTVDAAANEVYVADGYFNHRVIVFDADSGAFKRMWGAYGKPPTDEKVAPYNPSAEPSQQLSNVHCVRIARDGFVYVCDRTNNRIQVFRKDGTFVKEMFVGKETVGGSGSVWDVAFSNDPSQRFMILPDGTNELMWQLNRQSLEVLGVWGTAGHRAGEFEGVHSIAADSKGNLYTTETYEGKRIQRFIYKGLGAANGVPTLFQTEDPRARK